MATVRAMHTYVSARNKKVHIARSSQHEILCFREGRRFQSPVPLSDGAESPVPFHSQQPQSILAVAGTMAQDFSVPKEYTGCRKQVTMVPKIIISKEMEPAIIGIAY